MAKWTDKRQPETATGRLDDAYSSPLLSQYSICYLVCRYAVMKIYMACQWRGGRDSAMIDIRMNFTIGQKRPKEGYI